jgi:hypothetical protein
VAEEGNPELPQRSKNRRISVSPNGFSPPRKADSPPTAWTLISAQIRRFPSFRIPHSAFRIYLKLFPPEGKTQQGAELIEKQVVDIERAEGRERLRCICGLDVFFLVVVVEANFGHSFGHAVEACSHFSILHGQAVAIGMAIITRAAVRRGDCPTAALDRLLALLEQNGLPTETDYSADELFAALGTDKKLSGSTMHLVIPEEIGRCRIEAMPLADARELLRLGGVK